MADLDKKETIQIIWAKITLRINDYIALDMDYNIDSDGDRSGVELKIYLIPLDKTYLILIRELDFKLGVNL